MHQPLELPSAVSTATNGPHPDKNVQEGEPPLKLLQPHNPIRHTSR